MLIAAMNVLFYVVTAATLLALAMWVHWQVPAYTARGSNIVFTRAILVVVGIGFGAVSASHAQFPLLTFLVAFGFVHLPAAIILFVKRHMHAGRS